MTSPTLFRNGRTIRILISAIFGLISAALALISSVIVASAASVDDPVIYTDNQTAGSTIQDRDPGYRPLYLVYADNRRSADEAKKLVDDLGLTKHIQDYKTRVFVVGPSNGNSYDDAADLTAYQNFLRTHRSSNLKIIAVGAGATFVNNVISKHAYSVAGILTYGGSVAPGSVSTMPVPAYVHSADPAIARQYVQANGATAKVESPTGATYTNPEVNRGLQRVVVSKLSDDKENLAQAFQNAWKAVFSHNYRLYMSQIESYNQAFDPLKYTDPWELEPYVMYDELGIRYEAISEELPGFGLTLRYEYVPKTTLAAVAKSVPLVIMMHGNNNDPRIQGESGGWPEVAAKNNIILASIEWQGRTSQEKTVYPAIGEAGTMAILDRLLAKYPQVDPSRVYLTGLSAGAMNSFTYGIDNVSRIAAVEGSSAPFGPPKLLDAAKKVKADGNYLPVYSIAGNHDMYKPLPVTDTPRSFYTAIRAFALLDDIKVPDAPDLKVNEMFGLKLDGNGWGEIGGTRAMIGSLSNSQGVMIKLVALDPYGHWNFKPAAPDIWAFLSRFRRDLTTGKLVVTPQR
jgi:poly(3-hydroxybutyrate) depolymerase